jgi:hypothetical protein
MALASNTPTQIGSTFWPSRSRRMMIGMFVIGSTISPLMVISTSAAWLVPGSTTSTTHLLSRFTASPHTLLGPARLISTST